MEGRLGVQSTAGRNAETGRGKMTCHVLSMNRPTPAALTSPLTGLMIERTAILKSE